jgi:hypothetical protein
MVGSVSKSGIRFFSKLLITFIIAFSNLSRSSAEEFLTDPTRPSDYAARVSIDTQTEKSVSNYIVSQIYISSKTRMAIINNQTVTQGDRIGHAEIVAINSYSVQLLVDGKIKTIGIMPSIKQYRK